MSFCQRIFRIDKLRGRASTSEPKKTQKNDKCYPKINFYALFLNSQIERLSLAASTANKAQKTTDFAIKLGGRASASNPQKKTPKNNEN